MAIEIDALMQMITHAVIEATIPVMQAVMMEGGDETIRHRTKEASMIPRLGGPSPTFNFTKEVKNMCKTCNLLDWQALIQAEQEAWGTTETIYETISNKHKHPFNETVKSFQCCILNKHNSKNVEEWMKRPRINTKNAIINNLMITC